jgi:hypothetical protein
VLPLRSQGWLFSRHEEGGIIAFEDGFDTYHFGFNVDEIEAQVINNELCSIMLLRLVDHRLELRLPCGKS